MPVLPCRWLIPPLVGVLVGSGGCTAVVAVADRLGLFGEDEPEDAEPAKPTTDPAATGPGGSSGTPAAGSAAPADPGARGGTGAGAGTGSAPGTSAGQGSSGTTLLMSVDVPPTGSSGEGGTGGSGESGTGGRGEGGTGGRGEGGTGSSVEGGTGGSGGGAGGSTGSASAGEATGAGVPTTTGSAAAGGRPSAGGGAAGPLTACLEGDWEISDLGAYYQPLVRRQAHGRPTRRRGQAGTLELNISGSTLKASASRYTLVFGATLAGHDITYRVLIRGSFEAGVRLESPDVLVIEPPHKGKIRAQERVRFSADKTETRWLPYPGQGRYRVSCVVDTLSLRPETTTRGKLGPSIVYTRKSSP